MKPPARPVPRVPTVMGLGPASPDTEADTGVQRAAERRAARFVSLLDGMSEPEEHVLFEFCKEWSRISNEQRYSLLATARWMR